MKSKTKQLLFEIIVISGMIIIVTGSILADLSVLKIPQILIMNIYNQEELMFNLFATQATVATICIAIVSLISGVVSDSIYGISVTQYISQLMPRLFKHKFLILFSLIITFLNYFVVSYKYYNTSIAIFALSIAISVILVKNTFLIFLGRKELKKQIGTYILENYQKIGVDNFQISLLESDEVSKTTYLKENLGIIKSVFEIEIQQSKGNRTEIITNLETIISDVFVEISNKNLLDSSSILLEYIYDLYNFSNLQENPVPLTVWDSVSREFFKTIKSLSKEQLYNSNFFYGLHQQLYKNQKYTCCDDKVKFINGFHLKNYSIWIYYTLIVDNNNSKADTYDRKKLTKLLYSDLYYLLFYSDLKGDEIKKEEILGEYCRFIKAVIDENDYGVLETEFFDKFRYNNKQNDYQIIFLVACIYLYYISCREELVDGKDIQANAKNVLECNRDAIEDILMRVDLEKIVPQNLSYINDIMRLWEVLPEKEAKCIIMDGVIKDFFLLSSLFNYWSAEKIKKLVFALYGNNSFSVYNQYFGRSDYLFLLMQQFNTMFFTSHEEFFYNEKVEMLKEIINQKYKEEEIALGKKNQITDTVQAKFFNKLRKIFVEKIEENSYLFEKSGANVKEGYTTAKVCLSQWDLPSSMICDENLDVYLLRLIHSSIIKTYIHILRNSIKVQSVKYDDMKKQETLIHLIKQSKTDGDTYIGNRDVFWGESDKDQLNEFVKGMVKITYPDGNNSFYIINHKLVHCSFSDFEIRLEDFTQQEIEEMCKTNVRGEIEFNVTNDIYIPFERDELIEHIHRIRKKVFLYANIHYRLDSDNIGAGIEIKT